MRVGLAKDLFDAEKGDAHIAETGAAFAGRVGDAVDFAWGVGGECGVEGGVEGGGGGERGWLGRVVGCGCGCGCGAGGGWGVIGTTAFGFFFLRGLVGFFCAFARAAGCRLLMFLSRRVHG